MERAGAERPRVAPAVEPHAPAIRLVRAVQGLSDGFRADNGFVPQVGYRETFGSWARVITLVSADGNLGQEIDLTTPALERARRST
jgi:hypothetical protein